MSVPPQYTTKTAAPWPEQMAPGPEHVTPPELLSDRPAKVDCPICKAPVMTRTIKKSGDRAYMWGAILCFLTGCLCCIPCLMDECKDTKHTCSHCGRQVATVTSKGGVQVAAGHMTVPSQYERRNETMVASVDPH